MAHTKPELTYNPSGIIYSVTLPNGSIVTNPKSYKS